VKLSSAESVQAKGLFEEKYYRVSLLINLKFNLYFTASMDRNLRVLLSLDLISNMKRIKTSCYLKLP